MTKVNTISKSQNRTILRSMNPVIQSYQNILISMGMPSPPLASYSHRDRYVVIKSAASPEEVQKGIDLFWDLVEGQQLDIKRNDPSTWENWVASTGNGIMSGTFSHARSLLTNKLGVH